MFRRIGHRILAVVGGAVTLGLIGTGAFYANDQETSILAQNERTLHKVTESVIRGLESLMLDGHAEVMGDFARRLNKVPDAADFRILRNDGSEAFRDNRTIEAVNAFLGDRRFELRRKDASVAVVAPDNADFRRALAGEEAVVVYHRAPGGQRMATMFDPIFAESGCVKCHDRGERVRGVIMLTTSLAPVEKEILQSRERSVLVMGGAILGTLLLTGFMVGRTIVRPIEAVTDAMKRASAGQLGEHVAVDGDDELARMADSFNVMADELKKTWEGLRLEQGKLTTIILSAGEGMVITDAGGRVVLVNPAAEKLLGKTASQIIDGGFVNLVDAPLVMTRLLEQPAGGKEIVRHRYSVLEISAATIRDPDQAAIGSAALIRDVTEQHRLEEELRRLATVDPLTGLYNRRHLDTTLIDEFDRARRYQLPLAVMFFDVDHFKQFNLKTAVTRSP